MLKSKIKVLSGGRNGIDKKGKVNGHLFLYFLTYIFFTTIMHFCDKKFKANKKWIDLTNLKKFKGEWHITEAVTKTDSP